MKKMSKFYFIIFFLFVSHRALANQPDRLVYKTKINGKKVILAMDTGTSLPIVLWSTTAKNLGLELVTQNQKTISHVKMKFGQEKYQVESRVIAKPPLINVDGLVGLPFLKGKIWTINWDKMSITEIKAVPEEISNWKSFKLNTAHGVLAIELDRSKNQELVYIDTGSPDGISLSKKEWTSWIAKNKNLPLSLDSRYSPETKGFYKTKLSWADQFSIGSLKLSKVMLSQNFFKWKNFAALYGIEALKHFEIILDLEMNRIYLQERPKYKPNFDYNRFGATCIPQENKERLVCHVLQDRPAYNSGLRTGDILLKVNEFDMTKWQADPLIKKQKFWHASPGTSYQLSVLRKTKHLEIDAVLEEIFNIQ